MGGLFQSSCIPGYVYDGTSECPSTMLPLAAAIECALYFRQLVPYLPIVTASDAVLGSVIWDRRFHWENATRAGDKEDASLKQLVDDLFDDDVIRFDDALLINVDSDRRSESVETFRVQLAEAPVKIGSMQIFHRIADRHLQTPRHYLDSRHYIERSAATSLPRGSLDWLVSQINSPAGKEYFHGFMAGLSTEAMFDPPTLRAGMLPSGEAIELELAGVRLDSIASEPRGYYHKDPANGDALRRFVIGHTVSDFMRAPFLAGRREGYYNLQPARAEVAEGKYAEQGVRSADFGEARTQVESFQKTLGVTACIREALHAGKLLPSEAREIYQQSREWKQWVSTIGEDEYLAQRYVEEILKKPPLERFATKNLRFFSLSALGELLSEASLPVKLALLGVGYVDTMCADRLRGWSPTVYWDAVQSRTRN